MSAFFPLCKFCSVANLSFECLPRINIQKIGFFLVFVVSEVMRSSPPPLLNSFESIDFWNSSKFLELSFGYVLNFCSFTSLKVFFSQF